MNQAVLDWVTPNRRELQADNFKGLENFNWPSEKFQIIFAVPPKQLGFQWHFQHPKSAQTTLEDGESDIFLKMFRRWAGRAVIWMLKMWAGRKQLRLLEKSHVCAASQKDVGKRAS